MSSEFSTYLRFQGSGLRKDKTKFSNFEKWKKAAKELKASVKLVTKTKTNNYYQARIDGWVVGFFNTGSKAGTLNDNLRIKLKANKKEGWPEEYGTHYGPLPKGKPKRTTTVVILDRKYREGKSDDGLREVTLDQIQVVS